jgi:hypothetical protein
LEDQTLVCRSAPGVIQYVAITGAEYLVTNAANHEGERVSADHKQSIANALYAAACSSKKTLAATQSHR